MTHQLSHSKSGITTIAIIVAVTLILVGIIFSIQGMTLLSTRIGQVQIAEKTTSYAAESLMYDTISRMNDSKFKWPGSSLTDPPKQWGKVTLIRVITKNNHLYTINITATHPHASRRLQAELQEPTPPSQPLDIMLVTDRSGSMDFEGCTAGVCEPLNTTKLAAIEFINYLTVDDAIANSVRTGLITYNYAGVINRPLSTDHDKTSTAISSISNAYGGTNIHDSLLKAREQLFLTGPNRKKFIILLTDGFPNIRTTNVDPITGKGTYQSCTALPTNYNTCITTTIDEANDLKDNHNVTIFTIGLGLTQPHHTIQQQHIDFAHELLGRIASSPPEFYTEFVPNRADWTDDRQLKNIYIKIFNQILTNSSLKIQQLPA